MAPEPLPLVELITRPLGSWPDRDADMNTEIIVGMRIDGHDMPLLGDSALNIAYEVSGGIAALTMTVYAGTVRYVRETPDTPLETPHD